MLEAEDIFLEYLLIIPPNDEVFAAATDLKLSGKRDHGWNNATLSKPHFTISNFVHSIFNEERLLGGLRRLSTESTPFVMQISNFGHFDTDNASTIFARVINQLEFIELSNSVKILFKAILSSPKYYPPVFPQNPHLTIAKDIPTAEFLKAWPSWENRIYEAETNAASLKLLRRPFNGHLQPYKVIEEFSFLGLVKKQEQLELF